MINQLKRKSIVIGNHFELKLQNICWFQLLKREDLMPFFVTYDSKKRIFEFWTRTRPTYQLT